MKCQIHPENEAVGTCTSCGRPVCQECVVEVKGKNVCRECLASGKGIPSKQGKDPNTAFLLELIGGFLGFLGLGNLYVGRTNDGILRLIGWFLYLGITYVIIVALSAVIIGFICIPFQLALQIGVPIWSAMNLKNSLLQDQSL